MKKFQTINLLIILILAISLSLTGCKSKTENNEVSIDTEKEQETEKDITIEEETTEEDSNIEEELEEEQEDDEEIKSQDNKAVEEASEKSEDVSEESKDGEEAEDKPADEDENVLKIEGNVGSEKSLNLRDLKAMENIIFEGEYYSINNFGTTAHTNFKGVNLWKLLEQEAQISSAATKVTILAIDGYKMEFTIEQVKKQDYIDETNPQAKFPMIIAWEENGEEYDSEDGPPFKLVVGQKEAGDVNKPQWVSNIDKIIVE
ncbi:molybdopterin-dependent oxidoreductase [Clostridium sp. Cult2]|uniref:molybdopterin-dependent oxidoreductase n=1 Tax=Clostridium sp. Cult2 TaxID=2079003 RepID=UPI001F3B5E5B|nr:molybdopterin-dependent oxidoreductase [Clostridium sp. Cult2]MCF6465517.1 hypothetical protein [Clostridium sp. Cult2]